VTRRLVERESEIAAIGRALDGLAVGGGSALAILGPAGAGKTSLVAYASETAPATVLRATASELERDFPFGVVRQLLEQTVRQSPDRTQSDVLAGAARLAAPALGLDADPSAIRPSFGLLHGLYWVVANLSADQSLVLAIDDLQWADDASLQFLAYLVRRVSDLPVAIVTAARTGDPSFDRPTVMDLIAEPGVRSLSPAPLTREGIHSILRTVTGSEPELSSVERVLEATGGNPFLVRELAEHGQREGTDIAPFHDGVIAPDSTAQSIMGRLRRLGPHVVAVAEAVVTLGDGCALAEASAFADVTLDQTADAVSRMMRAQILERAETLSFVHPLVRAAVQSQLTPAERTALHGHAAQLLINRHASLERVVAQLLNSAPSASAPAVRRLREAGQRAMAVGAPSTAAAYLRRALSEGADDDPHGELLAELGLAELLSGAPTAAIPVLLRGYERSPDVRTLAVRCRMLWLAHVGVGSIEQGTELLEMTIDRIGDRDREARLMLEAEFYTAGILDQDRMHDAWARLEPFDGVAGETPAERRVLAIILTHRLHTADVPAETVSLLAARCYSGGQIIRENTMDPTQWLWGLAPLIMTDQLETAEAGLHLAQSLARATGSIEALAMASILCTMLRVRQGRLAEAEAEALDGLARLEDASATPLRDRFRLGSVRFGLRSLVARGRIAEADQLLRDHGYDQHVPLDHRHVKLLFERALVRAAQGRLDNAVTDALAIEAFNQEHNLEDVTDAPWRVIAAPALASQGETARALAVAERQLELARAWGMPRDLGIALRTRALVELDSTRRIELMREALETLRPSPAPLEIAETQFELGRSLLRSGQRTEARQVLAEALDGATRRGAAALIEHITTDLRVAGARPRRTSVTGVDALTPAERRTADMAASGLSNREVAQALFLSVRTVENTLRRVYKKLAISSRAHLPAALAHAA
jgi:DNA-binding CsgD family transcriptional regulator